MMTIVMMIIIIFFTIETGRPQYAYKYDTMNGWSQVNFIIELTVAQVTGSSFARLTSYSLWKVAGSRIKKRSVLISEG